MMIEASGYRAALITWGIIQGLVVLVAAQFLSMPPPGWLPARWDEIKTKVQRKVLQSSRDYTTAEMLRTASFYVLYLMMIIVAFSGLMVTAQLAPIATTYGFDTRIVFGSVTVLSLTILIDGVLNGATRPLFGWISDKIGRYETMAISFVLEALAIAGLNYLGSSPALFVVLMGLTFFAWGEIYSLFPSAIADVFGTRYATTNFGVQYTSKGVASILAGPGAALLWAIDGSWSPVLWTAVIGNVVAALAAVVWLKPLVKQFVAAGSAETASVENIAESGLEVNKEADCKRAALGATDGD
jgi:OFA family oxalate/formate antiporter-like MFS transporter